MFDNIEIDLRILPGRKPVFGDELAIWQTRSLKSNVYNFKIDKDGTLFILNPDIVETDVSDLPFPEMPYLGAFETKGRKSWKVYNYSGNIDFFTSVKDRWYDYTAEIYMGKVIKIIKNKLKEK